MSSGQGNHADAAYSTLVVEPTRVELPSVTLDPIPDQSQPLMQDNLADTLSSRAQYVNYGPEMSNGPSDEKLRDSTKLVPSDGLPWTPKPLRTWFWFTYVCVLIAMAIALEVSLHYSHKKGGWPTPTNVEKGVLHYVYTLPVVTVAMILVGLWTWTDLEVKRLQPYIDLLHGNSPAQRSLLLDYTRSHNAAIWLTAFFNRHYVVAVSSIMVLLALSFQPLSAVLFSVRDVFMELPATNVSNLQAISLNPAEQLRDLTNFLGASGYASASILYGLGDPPFIHDGYTVGEFELPLSLATDGTVKANTTAILTDTGCRDPDQPVTITALPDGSGWVTQAVINGCGFEWSTNKTSVTLFSVWTLGSGCGEPDGVTYGLTFSSVLFYFFLYDDQMSMPSTASVFVCTPTIKLLNVEVSVDLASSNLTDVRPLSNLTVGQGPFTQYAGNITGAPLYGRPYNGFNFSSVLQADPLVWGRAWAIQLQIPAVVYKYVEGSAEGLTKAFSNNTFHSLTATVYRQYLSILATRLYYINTPQSMPVTVSTFQTRVFLSDAAVHFLSAGTLLLALFGTILQLVHRHERRDLRLLHNLKPGTLASAGILTARTHTAELLDGRQRPEEMTEALQDRRFRIDPNRMKIVTEDEH